MKKYLTAFCFVLLSSLATGCATSSPQSYDAGRCSQLLQEADDLKGKPIRRSAKMDQYKLECGG